VKILRRTITILVLIAFASILISVMSPHTRAAATSSLSMINPGPTSKPTKWNAAPPLSADLGTNNFRFFAPQTPVNSTFFFNVTIIDATDIKGWGIGIVYDNTTLSFVSAWRPSDHVFAPAELGGATPIAPGVTIDSVDSTHQIVKWGYAYLWQDDMGNPVQWGFNGTGTLCQLQFKIITPVNAGSPQWTTSLTFDSGWTSVYRWDLPSPGKEIPLLGTGTIKYAFISAGPTIANPTQVPPTSVTSTDSVVVSANITDTGGGIGTVTLMYSTDNGATWKNVTMTYSSTTGNYTGTIPPQAIGTKVEYKVQAYDNIGNSTTNDNSGSYYVYTVISEFSTLIMLLAFAIASVGAVLATRKIKRR
jgi:hypothetical protein